MRIIAAHIVCLLCLSFSSVGSAHTSEQGFVLLLPTDVYISSGVLTVVLTVFALIILPVSFTRRLFTPVKIFKLEKFEPMWPRFAAILQFIALLCLLLLLFIGFTGTHDPLRNLLPLFIWTVFWIGVVSLHGAAGYLWHVINPFRLFSKQLRGRRVLPPSVGSWPGVVSLLLFSGFTLADTAPEDPPRLALIVSAYCLYTLSGCYLFGTNKWLDHGECFSMLMKRLACVSPAGLYNQALAIGFPGWKNLFLTTEVVTVSGAVFTLTILAAGSFDGVNETFWWLQQLGINPLEFPGRSAVVGETITGLLLSVIALIVCFALCVWMGIALANRHTEQHVTFIPAFTQVSVAIIPIALAYHVAHYLTAFMVNIQYTVAALTDPLQNGRDLLNLGTFYVTTGFFNTQSSVRTIWLSQAGVVVFGHVISLLLSHRIALKLWSNAKAASMSQIPLALFMVFYTLLGLWLLAAPRGA